MISQKLCCFGLLATSVRNKRALVGDAGNPTSLLTDYSTSYPPQTLCIIVLNAHKDLPYIERVLN